MREYKFIHYTIRGLVRIQADVSLIIKFAQIKPHENSSLDTYNNCCFSNYLFYWSKANDSQTTTSNN